MDDYYVHKNGGKDDKSNGSQNNERGASAANWSFWFGLLSIFSVLLSSSTISSFGTKLVIPAIAITFALVSRSRSGTFNAKAKFGLIVGIIMVVLIIIVAVTLVSVLNNPELYSEYVKTLKSMTS